MTHEDDTTEYWDYQVSMWDSISGDFSTYTITSRGRHARAILEALMLAIHGDEGDMIAMDNDVVYEHYQDDITMMIIRDSRGNDATITAIDVS